MAVFSGTDKGETPCWAAKGGEEMSDRVDERPARRVLTNPNRRCGFVIFPDAVGESRYCAFPAKSDGYCGRHEGGVRKPNKRRLERLRQRYLRKYGQ